MYRRSQIWMLIINNRFLSLYDYNFLLVIEMILVLEWKNYQIKDYMKQTWTCNTNGNCRQPLSPSQLSRFFSWLDEVDVFHDVSTRKNYAMPREVHGEACDRDVFISNPVSGLTLHYGPVRIDTPGSYQSSDEILLFLSFISSYSY